MRKEVEGRSTAKDGAHRPRDQRVRDPSEPGTQQTDTGLLRKAGNGNRQGKKEESVQFLNDCVHQELKRQEKTSLLWATSFACGMILERNRFTSLICRIDFPISQPSSRCCHEARV